MPRPTGVTVIAILMLFYALVAAATAVLLFVGGEAILESSPELRQAEIDPELMPVVLKVTGVFVLMLAVIPLSLGLGLWFLKAWARTASLVVVSLLASLRILAALLAAARADDLELIWSLVLLAVMGTIIWYLLKPDVKLAFVAQPAPTVPTDVSPPLEPPSDPSPPSTEPPAEP